MTTPQAKTPNEVTRDLALKQIIRACNLLGWQVAIPDVPDSVEVPGLVLGTEEFLTQYTTTEDAPSDTSAETANAG